MRKPFIVLSLLLTGTIFHATCDDKEIQNKDCHSTVSSPQCILPLTSQISRMLDPTPRKFREINSQMREEAALRAKGFMPKGIATPVPGGQPNYFGPEPNYANSPLPVFDPQKRAIKANTGIRKFVNSLAGLGPNNKNNLGNYIPVASPDVNTFHGSDYYELAVVKYSQKLHSDLGPTTLRGYVQTNTSSPTPQYLGPLIIAKKDRPVRIKYSNQLETGMDGNLFIPVDPTVMGACMGPDGVHMYTQNRTDIHLHGGATPWISDGTPHQWITPAGETSTIYLQGVSLQNVPDMTSGAGEATLYYPNAQSSRLMFYHDHTYGITRLNVYAGLAAGYLLTDETEESLIDRGILPNLGGVYRYGIPLIIQDKTFVPPHDELVKEDPTWNYLTSSGSLWFPHVYMPNQNPGDSCGCNNFGRWDYGPWFWPPVTAAAGLQHGPILDPNGSGLLVPGTPNPSIVPEAFMDTPLVNGTAYPYLNVDRKPYRFRILNACNDRYLNLQLYYAEGLTVSVVDGGKGYTRTPEVRFVGHHKSRAKGYAVVENGSVTQVVVTNPGSGYRSPPKVVFKHEGNVIQHAKALAAMHSEVRMVPACPSDQFPSYYPTMDGRAGGVPDPTMSGPEMIQIGTEGGFLPNPVVLHNTPIGYQYNRRDITVLNVLEKTLFLGPAERADVIIDFSKVPCNVHNVILYNDAPAPVPAFDPRNDYYTNDPDQTATGGAPSTIAGYGPNTRTIMQFRLSHKRGPSFNLKALQTALPQAYVDSQPKPIVPQTTYPLNYHSNTDSYADIQDTSLTYIPLGSTTPTTFPLQPKAIQELFELNYGRMNAILGTELPLTSFANQTTVPLGYRDPPTEYIGDNEVQLWKITHNGVDTHAIHVHLFNVQLINRVGWDGMIKPPDPNEVGWKETVRMNPLEDAIIALKPSAPPVPSAFLPLPLSQRLLDPTMNAGDTWTAIDPITGQDTTITNVQTNFGWEYMWHCHLLGHEENDMMRPIVFNLRPSAPLSVTAVAVAGRKANVTFSVPPPGSSAITGYTVISHSTTPGAATPTASVSPSSSPITKQISGLTAGATYTFTVTATNSYGTSIESAFSNSVVAFN